MSLESSLEQLVEKVVRRVLAEKPANDARPPTEYWPPSLAGASLRTFRRLSVRRQLTSAFDRETALSIERGAERIAEKAKAGVDPLTGESREVIDGWLSHTSGWVPIAPVQANFVERMIGFVARELVHGRRRR